MPTGRHHMIILVYKLPLQSVVLGLGLGLGLVLCGLVNIPGPK